MRLNPLALLAAGAVAALLVAGCSKGSDQSSSTTTTTTTQSSPAADAGGGGAAGGAGAGGGAKSGSSSGASGGAMGNAGHGKQIFAANCASCHGANAEGGVGPNLHNEKSRKNYDQTVAWIKNPQPPMPKLYPSPLSEKDVDDVAAYVQSL